jgi:aspartyl protease family protein
MKFTGFIVATLAIGALVGWLAPGRSGPAPSPGAAGTAAPAAELAVVREDGWNGGEVVLAREGDGHFYADVTVDAVSTRMLVDTGASVVALTGEDADAVGIVWSLQDLEPVARGASGPVQGVRVTIDRMQLGAFEMHAVEAVVIPEGLPVSLLGQSFLAQVPRVAMERETMVLGG